MADLGGKTIIITGAAVGIGEDIARAAVKQGARVALVDLDRKVEEVAASLKGFAVGVIGDVTDSEIIQRVVDLALRFNGRLDGLVNNAGVVLNGTALTTSIEDWDRSVAVNLTAPMLWIRAALPHMLAMGQGSIVNIASVIGMRARKNGLAYVSAKAGVIGLTRSVALDFGPSGVRCNAVSPGAVETPMLKAFDDVTPGTIEALLAKSFVGRLGTGEDIAEACIHLLSDRSRFTNGAEVIVDGGMTASLV